MIHLFLGTDRTKARAALAQAVAAGGLPETRITDAHIMDDFYAALAGGGMFMQARAIVLDGVLSNDEMREALLDRLAILSAPSEPFYIYEEKPDAATRKLLEKHAATSVVFDTPKVRATGSTVFALADAMNRGDKKNLWIGYQRQLREGNAPEAIHGVLFWGAKKALLAARGESGRAKPAHLVAQLAELPHQARRNGEDMEYALERFVLSV
jgi:hypothetical protein